MHRIRTSGSLLGTIIDRETISYFNPYTLQSSNAYIKKRFFSGVRSAWSPASARSDSPSMVQYTSGDKVYEAPLKLNPDKILSFDKAGLQPAVVESLKKNFKNLVHPTAIQKKMFALLRSDFSVTVSSPPNYGKSLALALYLASCPRSMDSSSITSLLLVPSPELALEYYKIFEKILIPSHISKHQLFQVLYRTGEDTSTADNQKELLMKYPSPYILIATPNRVLDFLASADRSLLPMNNLSCIAVDEMDDINGQDTDKKQSPLTSLISHIRTFRNAYVQNHKSSFTALRYIICTSDSKQPENFVKTKAWMEDRPLVHVSDSEKFNDRHMNTKLVMINYDSINTKMNNIDITESISDRSAPYYPITKRDRNKVHLSFAKIISELHNNKPAIIVACNSLSLTLLSAVLQDNYGILTAFPYGVNYAYLRQNDAEPQKIDLKQFIKNSEEDNNRFPRLLITRAESIRGLPISDIKRVYLLWHEGERKLFRQLSHMDIAYPTKGTDKRTVFSITVPTVRSTNTTIHDGDLKSMLDTLKLPIISVDKYLK